MENAETSNLEVVCALGCSTIEKLPVLSWLPFASYLIFFQSKRVALGLGLEHGHGFVISRILPSPTSYQHNASWSSPWFITVHGIECGIAVGAEARQVLLGVANEHCLGQLLAGKLTITAGYDLCWGKKSKELKLPSSETTWDEEISYAAVSASGRMINASLSGHVIRADKAKNEASYGPGATADAVLATKAGASAAMAELEGALNRAARAALVAAFEPSNVTENE